MPSVGEGLHHDEGTCIAASLESEQRGVVLSAQRGGGLDPTFGSLDVHAHQRTARGQQDAARRISTRPNRQRFEDDFIAAVHMSPRGGRHDGAGQRDLIRRAITACQGDQEDQRRATHRTRIQRWLESASRSRPCVDRSPKSNSNVGWGVPRIHGELLELGIQVSQATVSTTGCESRNRSSHARAGPRLRTRADGRHGPPGTGAPSAPVSQLRRRRTWHEENHRTGSCECRRWTEET